MEELIVIDDKKSKRKKIISYIIAGIIATTLFSISTLLFVTLTWRTFLFSKRSIVFSVFFGIVIYSLVTAITKRTSRATVICYILIFIIGMINQIKIAYTGEPLYFSDINFLSKSGDLIELVDLTITRNFIFETLMICMGFFLIIEILSFLSFKFDIKIESKKRRMAIIIVDIIIIILLFFPNAYLKNFYLNIFFDTGDYNDFASYTTNLKFYREYGFINGMYGVVLSNTFTEPENYDENELNNMLKNTPEIKNTKIGKPNIITVFSESFWDIDQLDEIEFDKPITNNFNTLKNEGKFVNMISPSYGGMSENVAFEFLTGGSMTFFPKGYIPIMSLYSRENSEKIPSLVKELNNNGYTSEIIFGKDYYNSEEAYLKVGFDEYEELKKSLANLPSDEFCVNMLMQRFNEKTVGEPLFYMLETIETHLPFKKDKYENYEISIVNSKLEQEMNDTLRSYAQGVYNADKQLGVLYEFIQSYEEPTLLIFFGDHLPFLFTENRTNVLFELDYFNTKDELLNDYRLYNTQALILANFDIEHIEVPEYMGVNLLFNFLLNHFDIEIDSYYKWLYNTTDVLAGSNKYVSFDTKGNLYHTNELNGEMKELYEYRDLMQYKFFINAK